MSKHTATVKAIDSRAKNIKVRDGVLSSALILECYHPDFELPFLRFFNCDESKLKSRKRYGVSKNSALADLYRTATGIVPPSDRYRFAHQLIQHLHGLSFEVEYELKKDHYRIGKIYPTAPVINDSFTAAGKLINEGKTGPKKGRNGTEKTPPFGTGMGPEWDRIGTGMGPRRNAGGR